MLEGHSWQARRVVSKYSVDVHILAKSRLVKLVELEIPDGTSIGTVT